MKNTLRLLALVVLLLAACSPNTPTAAPPSPPPPTAAPPATAASDPCPSPDENAPQPEIYTHNVYLTFTPDGRTFAAGSDLVLEHASVPDLVIGPDGALWMYYVNANPGQHGIFVARQTESGWESLGCVTLDGAFNGNAVDPNVTRLPDGRYRLVYFEGNFVSQTLGPDEPHPIYSAISEDGLHFTVEKRLFAYPRATDPSLVQLPDGSWLLAVLADGQTVLAASADGSEFSVISQVDDIGLPELFVFPDGSLALYLLHLYLSPDGGRTWELQEGVRTPADGNSPSIVALPQGGYAFAYKLEAMDGEGGPGPVQGPGANPWENMTPEQEACLRQVWDDETFAALTGLQRPPQGQEITDMEACGLQPPAGVDPGAIQPPGAPPSGRLPPVSAGGNGFGLSGGNPQEVALNLDLTQPYLLAFHACDMSAYDCNTPADHQVYLAQSADGVNWSLVPGWQPFNASVPDVIRRGDTLYLFTPGAVTRYHLDSGLLEATQKVTIEGLTDGFVDPSLMLDADGNLVLFFIYGRIGGDPGSCPTEEACTISVGVAREVPGSDGTRFTPLAHDAAEVEITPTSDLKTVYDPDIFFDGTRYVLYVSHGLSISVWTAPDWTQPFTRLETLPQGLLSYAAGGVPAGYYDPTSSQYWTYVHYAAGPSSPTVIRLARHATLDSRLQRGNFTTVLSGESIGLGANYLVASPSFFHNAP